MPCRFHVKIHVPAHVKKQDVLSSHLARGWSAILTKIDAQIVAPFCAESRAIAQASAVAR